MTLSSPEKAAIKRALDVGAEYGYGNIMAWLATEWACNLRDDWNLSEAMAIAAVSGRGPYSLPLKPKVRLGGNHGEATM